MNRITLLPLVIFATILSQMYCWWDVGHMITANIAQIRLNQLDPYAAGQVYELVKSINFLCDNKSQSFIQSASWADDLKGIKSQMRIWDYWHFVDSPYIQDGSFPTINYTEAVLSSVATVNNAVRVMKSNINKNTAERALFARYLVHLVGDIHQPLHSVALYNKTFPKGDAGGNFLKVKILNGSFENFHSFWDAGAFRFQNDSWFLVRPLDPQNLTALNNVSISFIQQYGKQVEEDAKSIDPAVWAYQSFRYAQNTTYKHVMTSNIADQSYTSLVYQTCKKRVTLAGYRLANIIMDIYNNPFRQTPTIEQIWNDLKSKVKKGNMSPNIQEI